MGKQTGAKTCKKIVSLSLLVTLGIVSLSSINNKSKKDADLNARIEQAVFGNENNVSKGKEETPINITMDGYIYIPLNSSVPEPVGYTEKEVETSDIYTKDEIDYNLDRIITFYTDEANVNKIRNSFSGHLMYGEIMEFDNQEEGKTNYKVYKRMVKERHK